MYKAIAVGFAFLYDRHHFRCVVGSGGLGWLLVLGSERDVGVDCVAQLRGLVAHAFDEGLRGQVAAWWA